MGADTDTADETASSPEDERMALLEINISNTNADSQVVLNDLRLLELLCMYPFLFSRQVSPQQDYNDWGWEQVTKAFNESYEGIPLSTPFSAAELQWRWEILWPLINSLARAKSQIPEPMWKIVVHLNNRLNGEKPKETCNSRCQDLVLSQLPFVEELSHSQRLRLEVEVLDLIMDEERRSQYLYDDMNTRTKRVVQSEYDEFFASIKVKELPPDTLKRLEMDNGSSSSQSQSPNIVNANVTGLVISNVFSSAEEVTNGTNVPVIKIEPVDEDEDGLEPPNSSPIKSNDNLATEGAVTYNVIVPIKSAKEFCKNVRVRLKRLDMDEYMPLSSMRRSSRFTAKH
ncbi:uncharacterized protein LOC110189298 [Drosophila serrata]|uniref:uncharacterized protein LOC110176788 n=1 Tax=Drosophila serrata TaxID=7274 RepID=UPI000A1CFF27|nr:uncharacterized protein LOC110176788 [Drosophila serrata]XP_020814988.1 uncharacterized protein LOC110189298 [Drosophila serrata]KAH8389731.1 hypothetical protein KR200_000531 [Drosophila serrata]